MKWHKSVIDLDKIPNLIIQIKQAIKNADPVLETLRCVYITDDQLIHYLTPFDFINTINDDLHIKAFYNYQVLET